MKFNHTSFKAYTFLLYFTPLNRQCVWKDFIERRKILIHLVSLRVPLRRNEGRKKLYFWSSRGKTSIHPSIIWAIRAKQWLGTISWLDVHYNSTNILLLPPCCHCKNSFQNLNDANACWGYSAASSLSQGFLRPQQFAWRCPEVYTCFLLHTRKRLLDPLLWTEYRQNQPKKCMSKHWGQLENNYM